MPSRQRKGTPPSPRRPTDAEIHAAVERTRLKTVGWTVVGALGMVCLMLLAAVPLAHAIAGKRTDFEVNVTLTATITLSIAVTISTSFALLYRRINQKLRARNTRLEADLDKAVQNVARLDAELGDAHGRIQDLEAAAEG